MRQRNRSVAFQESPLADTLENMSQGLVMIDRHSKVRVINRRALELLGLSAQHLVIFRSTRSKARGAAEAELNKALRTCVGPSGIHRCETNGETGSSSRPAARPSPAAAPFMCSPTSRPDTRRIAASATWPCTITSPGSATASCSSRKPTTHCGQPHLRRLHGVAMPGSERLQARQRHLRP